MRLRIVLLCDIQSSGLLINEPLCFSALQELAGLDNGILEVQRFERMPMRKLRVSGPKLSCCKYSGHVSTAFPNRNSVRASSRKIGPQYLRRVACTQWSDEERSLSTGAIAGQQENADSSPGAFR